MTAKRTRNGDVFGEIPSDDREDDDLRASLQYAIVQMVLQEDAASGTRTTSGATRALAELAWQYLAHAVVPDLLAFSNHASAAAAAASGGRKKPKTSSITTSDVALLLRKLPDKLSAFQAQFGTTIAPAISRSISTTATMTTGNSSPISMPLRSTTSNGDRPKSATDTRKRFEMLDFSSSDEEEGDIDVDRIRKRNPASRTSDSPSTLDSRKRKSPPFSNTAATATASPARANTGVPSTKSNKSTSKTKISSRKSSKKRKKQKAQKSAVDIARNLLAANSSDSCSSSSSSSSEEQTGFDSESDQDQGDTERDTSSPPRKASAKPKTSDQSRTSVFANALRATQTLASPRGTTSQSPPPKSQVAQILATLDDDDSGPEGLTSPSPAKHSVRPASKGLAENSASSSDEESFPGATKLQSPARHDAFSPAAASLGSDSAKSKSNPYSRRHAIVDSDDDDNGNESEAY